jgi:hypothetical protein
MLIARFREDSDKAGQTVTQVRGSFWIDDTELLPVSRLIEHDERGELDWVDQDTRDWVLGTPVDESPAATPEGPTGELMPPPQGWLTAERKRILIYVVVGLFALAAILFFGTRDTTPQDVQTSGAWVRVASISGSGTDASRPFEFTATTQRLDWTVRTSGAAGAGETTLCLVPAGTSADLEKELAVGGATITSGIADDKIVRTTLLSRQPGEYYVKVFSTESTWTVTVWEQR